MGSDPAQSSYCSDLDDKCRLECKEIRLDDFLQRECYDGCDEAMDQCEKENPESRLDRLEKEMGYIKMEQEEIKQREWKRESQRRKELKDAPQE